MPSAPLRALALIMLTLFLSMVDRVAAGGVALFAALGRCRRVTLAGFAAAGAVFCVRDGGEGDKDTTFVV